MALHIGYISLREFAFKRRWQFFKPFLSGVRRGLKRELREVPQLKDSVSYPGY